MRRTLIVMVKVPKSGRVKTRLGREIGMTNASWWYRHQVRETLRQLRDPRWRIVLAVTPDVEGLTCRVWPSDLARISQGSGDLGLRMARALSQMSGPALLIGSDIPGLSRKHIAEAFVALGSAQSVVGPAHDGGFWLIGLRHPARQPKGFLQGIRWSHRETLADTLPTLPTPVARAALLADVDGLDDLVAGRRKARDVTTRP